jgi:hypothetical protein
MITTLIILGVCGGAGYKIWKRIRRPKKQVNEDHYYVEGLQEVDEFLAGKKLKPLHQCSCKKCNRKHTEYFEITDTNNVR